MRVLLVINPRSRRGAESADLVREQLRGCGMELIEDKTQPVEAVVAGGGDGTIVRAVGLALERRVPLGIIPLGTFNDLAKTLQIPLDPSQACAVVRGGSRRRIDIGRVNDRYFVNEASVGLSARIARKQTPEIKRRFGWFGILGTTLQTLRDSRPFHVSLDYDSKTEQFLTVQLTVANSHRFGAVIELPDASIADGSLDLVSVEVRSWFAVVPLLKALLARNFADARGVRHRRSSAFRVITRRPHHVTTDGEPAGMTPATFEILAGALEVFVPADLGTNAV